MKTCKIQNCNNKHKAKGLCMSHYLKVYSKQWRKNNKDKLKTNRIKFLKASSGKKYRKARHYRRRIPWSNLIPETVRRVYKKYGSFCVLCGGLIKPGQDALEHNVPLSRWRENIIPKEELNEYYNLGVAHRYNSKERCNYKKGTMTLLEWRCKQLGIVMVDVVDPREFELCTQAQQIGY